MINATMRKPLRKALTLLLNGVLFIPLNILALANAGKTLRYYDSESRNTN